MPARVRVHVNVTELNPACNQYIFFYNFYSYTFFLNLHFLIGAPISPLVPYCA